MHLLFRSQHHRIAIKTVDIVMVPPCLLGIHTQGLAVHQLIKNLWGTEEMEVIEKEG